MSAEAKMLDGLFIEKDGAFVTRSQQAFFYKYWVIHSIFNHPLLMFGILSKVMTFIVKSFSTILKVCLFIGLK